MEPTATEFNDNNSSEEAFFNQLDDLAKIREAIEWERRLKQLCERLEKPRIRILRHRSRLVNDARTLRPDLTEAQACAWVDSIIGLQSPN